MAKDPAKMKSMGQAARDYIESEHKVEIAAAEYIDFFLTTIKRSNRINRKNYRNLIEEIADQWDHFKVKTTVRCILSDAGAELGLL